MMQPCITHSSQNFNYENQIFRPLHLLKVLEHTLAVHQLELNVVIYHFLMAKYYLLEYCICFQVGNAACEDKCENNLSFKKICPTFITTPENAEFLHAFKKYERAATISLIQGHVVKAIYNLETCQTTSLGVQLQLFVTQMNTFKLTVSDVKLKYSSLVNRPEHVDISTLCLQMFLSYTYLCPSKDLNLNGIEFLHTGINCIEQITAKSSYKLSLLNHLYDSLTINNCYLSKGNYSQKCHKHVFIEGNNLCIKVMFESFYCGIDTLNTLIGNRIHVTEEDNLIVKTNDEILVEDDSKVYFRLFKNLHTKDFRFCALTGLQQLNLEH